MTVVAPNILAACPIDDGERGLRNSVKQELSKCWDSRPWQRKIDNFVSRGCEQKVITRGSENYQSSLSVLCYQSNLYVNYVYVTFWVWY